MSLSAPPSVAGQMLAWAGSAAMAAAMLSGLGALVVTLPAPGESRGEVVVPMVLTLAAPEAVAALPTPPPEVSPEAPLAPMQPDAAALPPVALAEVPPVAAAAPRLAAPQALADVPVLADLAPPLPPPAKVAGPAAKPTPTPAQKAVEKPPAKPDPKPAKARPAKPQVAESVAASVAGDAGKTTRASRSDGVKAGTGASKAAMQRWGSAIRKRIEARKAYPAAANGAQGTVTVRLTVSLSGQLTGVAVVASSGHAALDSAAVKAVRSARLPAAPQGVTGDSASFSLPMKYAN